MTFDEILLKIKKNKLNHQRGYYNCIPFVGFDRLEKYLPGIEKSCYYLISASTSVGKSKLTRYLFIHTPIMYAKENPNIKLDILYFSLEENEEKVILSEMSRHLFEKYKKVISVKDLKSVGRYNTISNEDLKLVEQSREHVNNYLSKVQIIDNIRNPTGIMKYCREFALKIGGYTDAKGNFIDNKDIQKRFGEIKGYRTFHEEHYVIVLVDNYNLLMGEKGHTTKQAIDTFSSQYAIRLRDKFGFTVAAVQQLGMDNEIIEYNHAGKSIEEKLEPHLGALGDSKTTARDASVVISLFNPFRYKIAKHGGYDITKLKDNYRALKILKSRDGEAGVQTPLFFDGRVDTFYQLPTLEEQDKLEKIYKYIKTFNKKELPKEEPILKELTDEEVRTWTWVDEDEV